MPILETDKLCKNCFRYLLSRVSDCLEAGTAGPSDKDSGYVDKAASIIELNKCVSSLDIEVSPFRMPDELRKRSLRSYSRRKQSQVKDAVKSKLRRKISDAYDVPEEELNKTCSNKMCANGKRAFEKHMRRALRSRKDVSC